MTEDTTAAPSADEVLEAVSDFYGRLTEVRGKESKHLLLNRAFARLELRWPAYVRRVPQLIDRTAELLVSVDDRLAEQPTERATRIRLMLSQLVQMALIVEHHRQTFDEPTVRETIDCIVNKVWARQFPENQPVTRRPDLRLVRPDDRR